MGHILIKPDRDRDEYVYWSTEYGRPIAHGNRRGMVDAMANDTSRRSPGDPYPQGHSPEDRAARADRLGSSAIDGYRFGWWNDEEFILEQRGYLPRRHLFWAAGLLAHGLDEKVWDLMVPFEDETEVRRD